MVELERLVGLLHAEEKLRGHPTLKVLHTQVMNELHKLAAPVQEAKSEPEPEPEVEDEPEAKVERRV